MRLTKDFLYLLVIAALVGLCGQFYFSYRYQPEHQIAVYYNHDEELNKQIISVIRDADRYVYFSIYTFTRQDIKDALLAAKYRGLTVMGITDTDQYNQAPGQKKIIDELRADGIPIYEQNHAGIMHMKAVVTEKAYASGSYNWTSAATTLNDEVLEVGTDPHVRAAYEQVITEVIGNNK